MTEACKILQRYATLRILRFKLRHFHTSNKWSSSTARPVITISREHALIDDYLGIKAGNMSPSTQCTVLAKTQITPKVLEAAVCQATTDEHGCISLERSESLGGSYRGVQAMGLFTHASMREVKQDTIASTKTELPRGQLDVEQPFKVHLSLLKGHHTLDSALGCESPLATTQMTRHYMSNDVTRHPIRAGRVRGTLFKPKGPGPHPAVLDMWGSLGGLYEYRAALLASRGVMALALAYFNFEDLPSNYSLLDYSYFHEALDWLVEQPGVDGARVGAIGTSKGAEIAQMLAARSHKMMKCVPVGGLHYLWGSDLIVDGERMIGTPYLQENLLKTEDGTCLKAWAPDPRSVDPHICFRLEDNLECEVLAVSGETDEATPSAESMTVLKERLEAAGQGHRIRLLQLPGVGHVVNPPYTPHVYSEYHKFFKRRVVYGGQPDRHADEQVRVWREILAFLHARPGFL